MSRQGLVALPVAHAHAWRVARLPDHHRDPFDRLLVAQAQVEGLPIVTSDQDIRRYDVETIW
jgi:PIN domain nuclease of toxin-antitoxin system